MKTLRMLLALLLLWPALAAAEPVKLRTVAGATEEGELVSLSGAEVVLTTAKGRLAVPLDQVLDLAFPPGPPPAEASYTDVGLTDGSVLHCAQVLTKKDRAELKTLAGQEVSVPLKGVAYLLRDAQDAKVREEWQSLSAKRGNFDLLAVKLEGQVNLVDGTFGDGDEAGQAIAFASAAGARRQLPLARIHAIAFARTPDPSAPPANCKVTDAGRNVLVATRVEGTPDKITVATVAGAQVVYAAGALARIDYTQGKLAYLSDLDPVRVAESSNVGGTDHYRRDRNLDDGPLRLVARVDGRAVARTYARGLSAHATTELVYDIGGQYKEFQALAGVDPAVGGDGRVRLAVEADGKALFSAEFGRADEPKPIACDVRGVRQLRILVAPAGLLDLGSHVNLADAKLTK